MNTGSSSTSSWEYMDFELEIRKGTRRKYPVFVRSPAGEAQEEIRFPFDKWELENKLQALEIALLRSGAKRRRIPSEEEKPIQDFGQGLLQALLVGEVRTRYEVSLLEARRQNKGLRLKLRIQPPELARLPWEFLYDPDRDEYLSFSSRTPIVRYLDLHQPVEQLLVSPPLRILGMVASPSDLPELDVGHEKRLVEEATKVLRENRQIELSWLEGQTWSDLQQAMWEGPWHIFHFIGHGIFDEASDEGTIALSDEAGRRRLLGARSLARLLNDHYPLRLAFLNSCEGARGSARDAFSSTAATLVRRGVAAVVAMQYEITDEAAINFARTFYQAMTNGLPVDAAVAAGRTAVSMDSALEWGTPVLYMRSPNGRVFDTSTEGSSPETAHEEVRDRNEEPENRLNELYAQARRSYQAQEWETVVSIFDQIHTLDPGYPDPEGFLAAARQELADAEKMRTMAALYEQGLRYMESEEWAQALEHFEEVQQLGSGGYRDSERLLSRARQAQERRKQLDELYAEAQRLHRDRAWQQVVETFEQIHALNPEHSDPEGLEASAREALERAQKEQDALRRYRESVESAWTEEGLDRGEAERLRALKDSLGLSQTTTADVERQVMGDTIEALLKRQEKAAREQYRKEVEEAWADKKLSRAEAERLEVLASELSLGTETTANIERAVIGDTVQAILEQQSREEEERRRYLDELYAQARQLDQDQDWEAVVRTFEQINAEDPAYPDSEGLLAVARESLEQARRIAALYDQGLRHIDAEEWAQAVERFEEVQQLKPGYRDTQRLLSEARKEIAKPPTVEVPSLSGQSVSRVGSMLEYKGLKLNVASEKPSEKIPEGAIIRQRPEAGAAVEPGSFVSVTVSSGASGVKVPVLTGQSRYQAKRILAVAGLKLGDQKEAPSDEVPKFMVSKQKPEAGTQAKRGSSVSITVSSGPRSRAETSKTDSERGTEPPEEASKDQIEEKPRDQLDKLYAHARQLHQNQEWQAVLEVFEQIRAVDPAYPDPEGLLMSAREATSRAPEPPQREFSLSRPANSFFTVVRRVIFHPVGFFAGLPRRRNLVNPLLFALVCIVISIVVSGLIRIAVSGTKAMNLLPQTITMLIYGAVIFTILASMLHLGVMLIVGTENPGFRTTFRIASYGMVAYSLPGILGVLLPSFGVLLLSFIPFYIYWAFLSGIGVREMHQTTTGKAVLVVLTPITVFLLLILFLVLIAVLL